MALGRVPSCNATLWKVGSVRNWFTRKTHLRAPGCCLPLTGRSEGRCTERRGLLPSPARPPVRMEGRGVSFPPPRADVHAHRNAARGTPSVLWMCLRKASKLFGTECLAQHVPFPSWAAVIGTAARFCPGDSHPSFSAAGFHHACKQRRAGSAHEAGCVPML